MRGSVQKHRLAQLLLRIPLFPIRFSDLLAYVWTYSRLFIRAVATLGFCLSLEQYAKYNLMNPTTKSIVYSWTGYTESKVSFIHAIECIIWTCARPFTSSKYSVHKCTILELPNILTWLVTTIRTITIIIINRFPRDILGPIETFPDSRITLQRDITWGKVWGDT